MALLMAMAAVVRNYSAVGIFEHHSVLFVMAFGVAISKITSRLLVSELLQQILVQWLIVCWKCIQVETLLAVFFYQNACLVSRFDDMFVFLASMKATYRYVCADHL